MDAVRDQLAEVATMPLWSMGPDETSTTIVEVQAAEAQLAELKVRLLTHGRFTIDTALTGQMLTKALAAIAAPRHRASKGPLCELKPTPQRLGEAFVELIRRYPTKKPPRPPASPPPTSTTKPRWTDGGATDLADLIAICGWHHTRAHDPTYTMKKLPTRQTRLPQTHVRREPPKQARACGRDVRRAPPPPG